MTHLVSDVFQPTLYTLRPCYHCGKLGANYSLWYQGLPKSLPLSRPSRFTVRREYKMKDSTYFRHSSTILRWLRAELQHMTHRSWLKLLRRKWVFKLKSHVTHHCYIPQNDKNSSTFLTKSVLNRDSNVVEGNVGCACRCWIACFDLPRFYARSALDKNDSETILSLAAYSEAKKDL